MRAAVVVAFACAMFARASGDVAPAPSPTALAEELLRQADDERSDSDRRFRLADRAAAEAERATRARPDNTTAWILWARALAISDANNADVCRPVECAQAILVLERGRAADKLQVDAHTFAFELGIVHSRLGRFAEALAEYDRSLRYVKPGIEPTFFVRADERPVHLATIHGNAAETLMALGRLDDAILRYQKSIDLVSRGRQQWNLGHWGLAVAYDRSGEHARAADAAREALRDDPAMSYLRRDEGTFFEPQGDVDYYLGLGHEVAFREWGAASEAAQARAAWRRYLGNGPTPKPGSTVARYRAVARQHLAALERQAATQPPPRVFAVVQLDERRVLPALSERINKLVEQRADEIQTCQLRHAPRLTALSLAIIIDQQNGLVGVQHVEPAINSELSACLDGVLSHWRIPRFTDLSNFLIFLRFQ